MSGPTPARADLATYVDQVARSTGVVWVGDTAWERQGQGLRPLLPPHRWKPQSRDEVRRAIARSGASFAQWTEGWDTEPTGWWHVCCDDPAYDQGRLRKRPRFDVRHGLDACDVRLLDPMWFAVNGYPVYAAAFRRYGSRPVLSEATFRDEFTRHAAYPGRETWGAFVDGRLVAWESCLVIDDAVISSSAKADPDYLALRPNNALVYVLTRHYLRDRGMRYVSAGARVLMHRTNVQMFQERMGYRRVYCHLRVEVGWRGALLVASHPRLWLRGPLSARLGDRADHLRAFEEMLEIARANGNLQDRRSP